MRRLLARFALAENGTTVGTEMLAGATTFLTLSYIVFVQPAVMAAAGIPAGTALFATCVASAIACILMGLLANYPIALAPGMGHNFFFAYTMCAAAPAGLGLTWQQGLAAVFLSGSLFLVLSLVRFREAVIRAIPDSLKHAIAAGIGLLVALIGLEWSGLVADHPVTLVTLGDLAAPPALLALFGLALTASLVALQIRGALLFGIGGTLAAGIASGLLPMPERIVSAGFEVEAVLPQLDFAGLLRHERMLEVVLVLFFLDLFDTVGTLVGVGARAGFLRNGELPRAGRALFSDAAGTIVGASLGTSTITSYVESATGVQAGGRTGLANFATAALLLLTLFFQPLIALVGDGVEWQGGTLHPVLAPALIVVGALMARSAAAVAWDDPKLAIPCFLTMTVMPLAFSITEGIAFGVIGVSLLAVVTGTPRRVHLLLHVLAVAFVLRYVFIR